MKNIWLESARPIVLNKETRRKFGKPDEFIIAISKGSRRVEVRESELQNLLDHDGLCAEDELSKDLIARLQFDDGVLCCLLKEYEKFQIHVTIQLARREANSRPKIVDIAQFKRISIPLVRRIYPQLIANKIVSVQPLLGPTGLAYYLRFRYSENNGKRVSVPV